jgi:hypothetical protein
MVARGTRFFDGSGEAITPEGHRSKRGQAALATLLITLRVLGG